MEFRGAVITVGGTHEPIAFSLNHAKPRYVLFVASRQSKPEIEGKILPALTYDQLQYNCVLVSDPGDLAACYEAIREAIPRWLEERSLAPGEVYVDITGATKPMSAALAMAGAERFSEFLYVSGSERFKGGLGVVVSGAEEVFRTVNPCDKLASRERHRATWLFRNGYAEEAARQLSEAAAKCSPELRQELKTLSELADCFAEADRFHFGAMNHNYGRLRDRLSLILSRRYTLFEAIEHLAAHWRSVIEEKKSGGAQVAATLRELLANAQRRATQCRYDDAIARLYRAAELFAQGKLYDAFGAKLGKVLLKSVPPEHAGEWVKTFGDGNSAEYKLGVQNGFSALAFSPHADHPEIARRLGEIASDLQKRNNSILAHGLQPCGKDDFEGFWQRLLHVIEVREQDIPCWPGLDF
ncbi:MAG: TIGR02710 family CRISPR-associated CARF protein [Terriglobia bacterium]